MRTAAQPASVGRSARERIVDAAYDLFAPRGVRDVGVDEVIQRSGVAKATLYHHFASKDDLVVAFLEERERRWTHGFVETGSREREATPDQRLLAIFDVFDDWFREEDYEGCSFINVLLEMGPRHRLGRASIRHLENIRSLVQDRAEQAGLREPEEFAHSWNLLMKGAIIAAAEGDTEAAKRARVLARHLMDLHR